MPAILVQFNCAGWVTGLVTGIYILVHEDWENYIILYHKRENFEMPSRHFGADGLIIASAAIRYGNIFLTAALFYS